MKHYDHEEDFHARDRKQFKKLRKEAQNRDQSKFKKTDQTSKEASIPAGATLGRVLSISGEGSLVEQEGNFYLCSLKGILKKEKGLTKNLVVAGDFVYFTILSEKEGAICQIAPRKSILSRIDISGKKEQLIATNVDLVVICVSLLEPPLKPSLIDRYLIAAEKGGLTPVIVINKIDLLETAPEDEKMLYQEFLSTYTALGYPIFSVSTTTKAGIEDLRLFLHNKTSVFSGQSGVGKSSLLNACFGFSLKTGELTQKTAKGAHTTTMATLICLPGGGYCVDTPGIRSFGIWSLKKEDVVSHFRDLIKIRNKCRYPDCTHIQEPDCAVQKALEKGKLSSLRYESYCTLLAEASQKTDKTTWG